MMDDFLRDWPLYLWWLLTNCIMHYLAFDFLLKITGVEGRRYIPLWLAIGGIMTLCAIRFQIPGLFLFYVLMMAVFGKLLLKISWAALSAPAAILFMLHTLIEGEASVVLAFLSANAKLGSYGWLAQVSVSFLSAVLFFLALFFIRRTYAWDLRQSVSSYLYVLLLPCGVFILAIRWALKLDTPAFAAYLSSFGMNASLTALLIMTCAAVIFFLMIGVFCKMVSLSGQEREMALLREQLEGQKTYVEEARKRNEAYASFQHDIANHLLVLSGLLKERRYEEAERFAEKLHESRVSQGLSISTGSPVLDVLLNEKISYARRKGVQVSWDVRIPDSFHGEELDLCVVFANIMDNAVAACAEVKEKRPFLWISTKAKGNLLVIESRNVADIREGQVVKLGTGLSNIRAIAEKYQGAMELEASDGAFQISVLLCSDCNPSGGR